MTYSRFARRTAVIAATTAALLSAPVASAQDAAPSVEKGSPINCTAIAFDLNWWLVPDHPCSLVDPTRFSLGSADVTLLPQLSFGSHDDVLPQTDYQELFSIGSSAIGIR
ncbi:hypothetical protein [Corynebacterium sp. A21]|uniref:hypothetical protein n=1 Tax=Corynebacterium sp. A21 TaxID=3457318 RepID=UPI003FD1B7EF